MKRIGFTLFIVFWICSQGFALQRFALEGISTKFLTSKEILLMREVFTQLEMGAGMHLQDQQARQVISFLDDPEKWAPRLNRAAELRRSFNRLKVNVAADWSLNTGQRLPNLDTRAEGAEPHELHHICFLRYGGQNAWWNIFPLPKGFHHEEVHGANAPSEVLQRGLLQRYIQEKGQATLQSVLESSGID